MERKVNKTKTTAAEKRVVVKGISAPSKLRNAKQTKRGWSDVFDNLTYSEGPGDNIYVFG